MKSTKLVELALDALLREIIQRDLTRSIRNTSLVGTPFDFDAAILSKEEIALKGFFEQPIDTALRQAVRRTGEYLFDLVGNTDEMCTIAENVSALDQGNYGRRLSVIEYAWDGIGSGNDFWYA